MFDAHVMELWPPLVVGSKVVVLKRDGLKDFEYLQAFLRQHAVTRVWFVPSAVSEFMQNFSLGATVTRLLIGGEAVPLKLCADMVTHPDHPKLVLHNIYGPTECSVMSTTTAASCMEEVPKGAPVYVPIGKPCWWHDCWVLDQYLQPTLSRQGELCILGDGLGDGYKNLPEVTAKTFVPTPEWLKCTGRASSPKMYRTGDLVRWLPSGDLDFIGRIDFQVKLRGLRIELGEIESILRGIQEVTEVVVRVRNEKLVAYFSGSAKVDDLRNACKQKLPMYMVPTCWTPMETWPRGTTGKIDTKALPDPKDEVSVENFEAPQTKMEQQVATLFKEALMMTGDISVTIDFFSLGGTSLKAATVLFKTKALTGGEQLVTFSEFHRSSSIRELANLLTEAMARGTTIPQLPELTAGDWHHDGHEVSIDVKASCGQEQMLIFFEMNPESFAYNVPVMLRLQGAVDTYALVKGINWLAARHHALRMNVDRSCTGEPLPCIYDERDFQVPFHVYNGRAVESLSGPTAQLSEAMTRARASSGCYSPRHSPFASPLEVHATPMEVDATPTIFLTQIGSEHPAGAVPVEVRSWTRA